MSSESARCQYKDMDRNIECELWYPYEEGQRYCNMHRSTTLIVLEKHVVEQEEYRKAAYMLTIPQIEAHLKEIKESIKALERESRQYLSVMKDKKDKENDVERAQRLADTKGYRGPSEPKPKSQGMSIEEKVAKAKPGLPKMAAMCGVAKMEDFFALSTEERDRRVADFKAKFGDKNGK